MIFDHLEREFNEQGYIHWPGFFNEDQADKLIFRMKELIARFCPSHKNHLFLSGTSQTTDDYFLASAHNISFFFDKNSPENNLIEAKDREGALNKVGHALHVKCPVFKKFSHQEQFFSLSRKLGLQKPSLVQSMFIFKQAKFGDEVIAHQDATFIHTFPQSLLGFWLALEDADADNGCLWVMPKGHKLGLESRYLKNNGVFTYEHRKKVLWPKNAFIPIKAKKGDALIMHGLLPHKSEKNFSGRTRFAYTLHFVDDRSYFSKRNWLRKPDY